MSEPKYGNIEPSNIILASLDLLQTACLCLEISQIPVHVANKNAIQLFLSFLDEMYCPWHIYHSNVNNLTVFWPLYSILSCWYFTKRCRYFAHIFASPSLCLILLRVISCSSKPKLILIEAMLNYLLMSRLFLACIERPK